MLESACLILVEAGSDKSHPQVLLPTWIGPEQIFDRGTSTLRDMHEHQLSLAAYHRTTFRVTLDNIAVRLLETIGAHRAEGDPPGRCNGALDFRRMAPNVEQAP